MNNTEAVHVVPIVAGKKPKPEMKDAVTQTERSDLAIIKARQAARSNRERNAELLRQEDLKKREKMNELMGVQTKYASTFNTIHS